MIDRVGNSYAIRVATSDSLIQIAALRSGVLRVSAREMEQEVLRTEEEIREAIREINRADRRKNI